jgi:hypothetical protein
VKCIVLEQSSRLKNNMRRAALEAIDPVGATIVSDHFRRSKQPGAGHDEVSRPGTTGSVRDSRPTREEANRGRIRDPPRNLPPDGNDLPSTSPPDQP